MTGALELIQSQTPNQLILYHPPSHALAVQPHPSPSSPVALPRPPRGPIPNRLLLPYRAERSETPVEDLPRPSCPYCSQILPLGDLPPVSAQPPPTGGYFEILERAHEGSRPPSPRIRERSATPAAYGEDNGDESLDPPAKGYYERFFKEERRLGAGAEGSVFLATHIIGGNVLGKQPCSQLPSRLKKNRHVRCQEDRCGQ